MVLAIFTFGCMAFFFWYWSGLHFELDSTVFNNIATPIAAMVSICLFVWISWKQLRMIENQNIKSNFEKKYELVLKKSETPMTPLPHKTSVSYTDERPRDLPFVTVSKRGIESLCREVLRTVQGIGRR